MSEPARELADQPDTGIRIGLNAAIVTVREDQPHILVVGPAPGEDVALPYGPFAPTKHRTLEIGLRDWVSELTGVELGYVEQLYTFGDRGRHAQPGDVGLHEVSIGYLALARTGPDGQAGRGVWRPWYGFFPWEDWRSGRPEILNKVVIPLLQTWCDMPDDKPGPPRRLSRPDRLRLCFALEGGTWDEEKVLDRYELLYEAGLVAESKRDGRSAAKRWGDLPMLGQSMCFDHRRILATAISRLRGKLKYRPVIFELMPQEFTLFQLQRTVEAISGTHLHKQNFRRLVDKGGLVVPTGGMTSATGGRPAQLFRFRQEVVLDRLAPGLRVRGAHG